MENVKTGINLIRDITFENDLLNHFKELNIAKQRLDLLLRYQDGKDVSFLERERELEKKIGGDTTDSINGSKENVAPNTIIKQEKLSIETTVSTNTNSSSVAIESNGLSVANDMPAPQMPVKKKKIKQEVMDSSRLRPTRSTRSKVNKQLLEPEVNYKGKDSVLIQNTTITVIDITDEVPEKPEMLSRNTLSKTRGKKKQETTVIVPEVNGHEKEIDATLPVEDDINKTSQTEYEDAIDEPEVIQNLTHVVKDVNSTMIVEKLTVNQNNDTNTNLENYKTPVKNKSKKEQIAEIFSPYAKSSTKMKVNAFEKLTAAKTKIPVFREDSERITPAKPKPCTPFNSKFLPKSCSTQRTKGNMDKSSSHNDSGISTKSLSALKASQAEYREREKRRQEKEREALLKKEAMLQAQTEEKRRKREEKQLKAQQQREALQKEKEWQIEAQKIKDEKYKQALAEKKEKLQKSKEEAEKKRLLAKIKAKTAKEEEWQEAANEEQGDVRKIIIKNNKPIYLQTRAPLLPTGDCYDSDDEQEDQKKYVKPNWARDSMLEKQLYAQLVIKSKVVNTLFNTAAPPTPDLVEIFERIDPNKLKRTSSAVWKKPPRYTLFSTTLDIHFSDVEDMV